MIDPNFLSSRLDIHVIVESIKAANRFVGASAWDGYVISPFANLTTEADFEAFARNFTWTEWHPVGTASTSAKGVSYGVVNPDLTVKGVLGIRIVDASIIVR
jgi:choline dehydrogenase